MTENDGEERQPRRVDRLHISGARALRRVGFDDAFIERALGYMPPIDMSEEEIEEAIARQPEPKLSDPDEPYDGDP